MMALSGHGFKSGDAAEFGNWNTCELLLFGAATADHPLRPDE
jgi:hypothetical protein